MRYKGRKSKGSISKLFRRFILLSASFQTSSRRIPPTHAVAERVQRFAGDCVAGGRGARSWGGLGTSSAIRVERNLNIAPIQILGKESSIQESTPRSASIESMRKAACPKDERAAA